MKASNLQLVFERFEEQLINSLFQKDLSISEVVSLYLISHMSSPTIAEYANQIGISQSNATYTVHKLVDKKYLNKSQSVEDRRQFHLTVTEKFEDEIREIGLLLPRLIAEMEAAATQEEREVLEQFFQRCLDREEE